MRKIKEKNAANLLRKSKEEGFNGILLTEGLSISREMMNYHINDLKIDLRKECYFRSPSRLFVEHIYDKRNDKTRTTS